MSLTGGRSPRDQGNRAERLVAKYLGGERVVGSGAYKYSNKNLVGDVDVWLSGRPYIKLEVKTTGRTNKNGPVYSLPYTVLEQMQREAEQYNEFGCVWVHYKNNRTHQDITVWPVHHLANLVADASFTVKESDQRVVGKKSVSLERDTLLNAFPAAGQYEIGVVYCELEVDGVRHVYAVASGRDVAYLIEELRRDMSE